MNLINKIVQVIKLSATLREIVVPSPQAMYVWLPEPSPASSPQGGDRVSPCL